MRFWPWFGSDRRRPRRLLRLPGWNGRGRDHPQCEADPSGMADSQVGRRVAGPPVRRSRSAGGGRDDTWSYLALVSTSDLARLQRAEKADGASTSPPRRTGGSTRLPSEGGGGAGSDTPHSTYRGFVIEQEMLRGFRDRAQRKSCRIESRRRCDCPIGRRRARLAPFANCPSRQKPPSMARIAGLTSGTKRA